MTPDAHTPLDPAIAALTLGAIDAVSNIPGMSAEEQSGRRNRAMSFVRAVRPRDAVEAMLAAQCVLYDNLLEAATRDLLAADTEVTRRKIRPSTMTIGKVFLMTLETLQRLRAEAEEIPEPAAKPSPRPAVAPSTAGKSAAPPVPSRRSNTFIARLGAVSHSVMPLPTGGQAFDLFGKKPPVPDLPQPLAGIGHPPGVPPPSTAM